MRVVLRWLDARRDALFIISAILVAGSLTGWVLYEIYPEYWLPETIGPLLLLYLVVYRSVVYRGSLSIVAIAFIVFAIATETIARAPVFDFYDIRFSLNDYALLRSVAFVVCPLLLWWNQRRETRSGDVDVVALLARIALDLLVLVPLCLILSTVVYFLIVIIVGRALLGAQ